MCAAGFAPDFPADVLEETRALDLKVAVSSSAAVPDLRSLEWSSIDNVESRDLDQIEVAEQLPTGEIRISIGIADVDSLVPKGSATDLHAASNAISVYTGVATFPLFPPEVSNDLTSLLEGQDRLAVVIGFNVAKSGRVSEVSVRQGLVCNQARVDYEAVGAWLESVATAPPLRAASPWLSAQLPLQDEAANRLHEERIRAGALEFESIEPRPIMQQGAVVGLALQRKNRARALIENFMVAANSAIATFLEARGWPSLQRVVRTPERWARIVALAAERGERLPEIADSVALAEFLTRSHRTAPEQFADLSLAIVKLIGAGEYVVVRNAEESFGHFGLAVHDYAHATAPNRRYPDLITQRLMKAALAGEQCPYTCAELEQIAAHCNERGSAARKVERQIRKVAAASFLSSRVGETFDAIVTGASKKGTYVRVKNPPVEGRVVQGAAGLDVGEKVRVRLVATDPERGFIDFARHD
jgi:VacB/RNase II family 3'-5' exoribonuclease